MNTSSRSGSTSNGESRVVLLRRAGSGGCVISPPNQAWLDAVKVTAPGGHMGAYEPYTDFRIGLVPESKGYGDMPGCSIAIIPGDHGGDGFQNSCRFRFAGIPTSEEFLNSPVLSSMLKISTNFDDLKALHAALGEVISSIEEKSREPAKA